MNKKIIQFIESLNWKNTKSFIVLTLIATVLTASIQIIPEIAQAQTTQNVIENIGNKTNLPSFSSGHADQSYQAGASTLTSAVFFVIDFFKYILGSIAVLMIIISGMKLILAGRQVESALSKEKETIRYAFVGLLLILVADQGIRLIFFGEEGEVFRTSSDMEDAAKRGDEFLLGITNVIRVFIPVLAVLFLVISGVRLVASTGKDEQYSKAKTQITWSILGLILAGLAEVVVFRIIFPNQGTTLSDTAEFSKLIVTITNFIAGFASTISIIMIIYAGYLYIISSVQDQVDKAKKILFGAIIGLVISMAAFGLVNTFVKVEPLTDTPTPQEVRIPNT